MGARNIACKCRSAGQAISPVAGAAPFEAVLIDSGEARCPVRSPAGARASGRVGCRAARRRSGSSFRRFRQDHPHARKRRSGDLAGLCPQRCSASRPYGVACRILDLLRAEPDRDSRVVHDQPGRAQRPHQASLRRWNRYEHPMATCDLGAQHRVRRRVSCRRRVADRLRCEQHLGGYGRWLKSDRAATGRHHRQRHLRHAVRARRARVPLEGILGRQHDQPNRHRRRGRPRDPRSAARYERVHRPRLRRRARRRRGEGAGAPAPRAQRLVGAAR